MFGGKAKNPELSLFTVFDSKAKTYDVPALSPSAPVLLRDVVNMLKDPQQSRNQYVTNAEDYSIFKIGTFDRLTGKITAHELEHVANMHDLRAMATEGALSTT